ncbi:hypothetical protein [Fodinibius sp.]|uniref:hypothetical protein n=1 Tax=Fodinibius sp. TaxID=1872440 RepID=UPI0035650CBF
MPTPKQDKRLAMLVVMLTLGTSWAIRGSFGHEFGAAWAGSIGVLSLVLVSGREDWIRNWPAIAAMGAIGWGMTGMISYGQVVGYGKSTDFLNVSYGLLSLFLIGGLFGFLGGGLTGLMLETTKDKKANWAALITQMVAGGYIVWGYLIYQLEWYMTPPRSELWAACLGASAALGWYLHRHHFKNAWYVAFSTMLGAGFGFAFGNVIQVMGSASGIAFNWWNVMEYSIGFFGGLGMAAGVFIRKWPHMRPATLKTHGWAIALLFLFIPLVTIVSTFSYEEIAELGTQLSVSEMQSFYLTQWGLVMGVSVLALIVVGVQFRKLWTGQSSPSQVVLVLFTTWIWYKLLQIIESGVVYRYHFTSDDLALLNIIAVALIWRWWNVHDPFASAAPDKKLNAVLVRLFAGIILALVLLSGIASNTHGELPGQQQRFNIETKN